MRPSIEPGVTAAELHDVKLLALQVVAVDVGDLKLPARRRVQASRNVEHRIVVEVKARHRPVRYEPRWLLDQFDDRTRAIELKHAVLTRLIDIIGKYGSSARPCRSPAEF